MRETARDHGGGHAITFAEGVRLIKRYLAAYLPYGSRPTIMSSPPRVFAAQNGKYKYAALADIQKASLV